MTVDALAASRSHPFPWDTKIDREFGRHTITTGMPTVSSPVTLASRPVPMTARNRRMRATVSLDCATRWVPPRNPFSVQAPPPLTGPS